MKIDNHFDVIIIGAGAAGLICAMESGKRGKSVLLIDHSKKIGEKIVKMFPNGVNLQNLIEATIIVLKEVSELYKLKPQHKIDLIVDILIYTIDNTDAGSLEALDPILKQLIPGVIDNMLQVDEGKLVLHKKNIVEKYLCCKK